jgi:hypothetical protein
MKSKEQILDSHYSQGTDGSPEIALAGLLQAMEEYKQQAEEAAFLAARSQNGSHPVFSSFKDYQASLQTNVAHLPKEDNVRLVADSIIEQFLPDDPNEKTFEFSFKTEGISYTVQYKRNIHDNWEYAGVL